MKTLETLNVTEIEPRFKHQVIFEKFDSLPEGLDFTILNDHDPKPLYYQLIAERGKVFTWEYLESGPVNWKVRIGKKADKQEETIGEIVTADFRKAQVFKKFGIDFCCGGKKTLEEVCSAKGINIDQIRENLRSVSLDDQSSSMNFDQWAPDFLTDYIINVHHKYVKENIPFIKELANKVARVHGDRHPETVDVADIFEKISKDFSLHLMKEEQILFPYIKELVSSKRIGQKIGPSPFGSVDNPTRMMEMEHEQAGEDMSAIRNLTNGYSLPADACASYTILYKKLAEFENDLFNHVHLENNILFPKAIALEKEINSWNTGL
jgi:regulator of cell morphogenesis and NO signaling